MFGTFFVLLAAAALLYFASALALHGNVVAGDLCRTGGVLCRHPEVLALAAGGAAFAWLATRER
jgi:hypothetical protein